MAGLKCWSSVGNMFALPHAAAETVFSDFVSASLRPSRGARVSRGGSSTEGLCSGRAKSALLSMSLFQKSGPLPTTRLPTPSSEAGARCHELDRRSTGEELRHSLLHTVIRGSTGHLQTQLITNSRYGPRLFAPQCDARARLSARHSDGYMSNSIYGSKNSPRLRRASCV